MSPLRIASGSVSVSADSMSEGMDWVVLLHGLFASRKSMRLLENAIRDIGYGVHNWGYSTWWRSTDTHVARLIPLLDELQTNPHVRTINFVTHSMGGILVRCALHVSRYSKVKRFVMLAPPNRGSHLTRIKLGPFAWCVPSIADLSEAPDSLPNRLRTSAMVEIGVIAASRDLVVPIANTSLVNQSDHCIVSSSHFNLPKDKIAVSEVLFFLRHGRFSQTRGAVHRIAA